MEYRIRRSSPNANIFVLVALTKEYMDIRGTTEAEISEMCDRVFKSNSYEEAIVILNKYRDIMPIVLSD